MRRSFLWFQNRLIRPRFSLRALFALIAAAAVCASVVVRRVREQHSAVQLIRDQGGFVYYDFQERPKGSGKFKPDARSGIPSWVLERLGEDFFSDVVFVQMGTYDIERQEHKRLYDSKTTSPQYLRTFRKLRYLVFMGEEVTDETLSCIAHLNDLEVLISFSNAAKVTDVGMVHLAGLRNLKTIALSESSITDASLRSLSKLRSLEQLSLGGGGITDQGLVHLQDLTKLQLLSLDQCKGITDSGLSALGGLVRLESLDLIGASISSSGLAHLKSHHSLRSLDLSDNRNFSDEGLRAITQFARLETLRLQHTRITSTGMRHLRQLKTLKVLDLSDNGGVTDDGVACLSSLDALEELILRNSGISSSAVSHLTGLKKLRILDLSENSCIDSGILPHLRNLIALSDLDLHHTSVRLDQESAAWLKGASALRHLDLANTGSACHVVEGILPNCRVIGSRDRTNQLIHAR